MTKFYFANWAFQMDFDVHVDDHGFDELLDLAAVNGQLYHNVDEARAAAEFDFYDRMAEVNEFTEEDETENTGICWAVTRIEGDEQIIEGRGRDGELHVILVVREYTIEGDRIVRSV